MPRAGVEQKPPWSSVPLSVRSAVAEALGADVRRALRVWGGYSATPTYRLRLADGRRAFFKAATPASTAVAQAAHAREERVYRQLGHLIAPWAPVLYGAFTCDAWHILLLEDLGPSSVPPWSAGAARRVAHAYADFHRATMEQPLPDWLPLRQRQLLSPARLWTWAKEPAGLEPLAALTGTHAIAARRWLEAALPVLTRSSHAISTIGPPNTLLHGDTRSDNLRWKQGQLRLMDWPHAGIGPAEDDIVAFAESVTAEGGPAPEQVLAWYAERGAVRSEALDAAVASLAGFFADQAWRPALPDLPRLRPFHRRQLVVTLAWAARRLQLPEPRWLAGIPA